MTTYNTRNPVPSADARDRHDNSQILDELTNGQAPRTPDRLGILRQSWAGIEAEFLGSQTTRAAAFQDLLDAMGWSSLGAYAAGISITSHTQTVDYDGQPYQLKPSVPASIDAPYVTTGNWATEGVNFKLVGDNSLRQSLADPSGASLVGWQRSRLAGAVTTVNSALNTQPYSIFEFEYAVTSKPNPSDTSTWDWAPACAAALTLFASQGGGCLVFPAGYSFPFKTKVGKFVNIKNVTLLGYGAEIVNFTGPLPMMVFGDDSQDGTGRFTSFAVTVKNFRMLGISFRSGNPFGSGVQGADRWADASPVQFNTTQNAVVRDCSFTDLDFSAIDFGAASRDCLVDRCRFYSSVTDAGHTNYGVRIFCYSTSTGVNLSPTDPATGLLLPGYTLPPVTGNFGHENVSVTNCYFENISHGVMVFAGRRGLVHGNTFVNMSTRSISLATYANDYLCSGNTHILNTAEQLSDGVSVFYNFGQESLRNTVRGDKFTVHGGQGNATGFSPIKALLSARGILIEDCEFQMPSFNGGNGQFCIAMGVNSEANIKGCFFNCPLLPQAIAFQPLGGIPTPGFQQGNIEISGNTFNAVQAGCIQIADTTSAPGVFTIKDNVMVSGSTRFVVNTATAANKVPRLMLSGNKFLGVAPRYVDNVTAFKAKLLGIDTLEFSTRLMATGAVNPSSTPVTFDFSAYLIPPMFATSKSYQFTAYGGRENAQLSTDFFFRITGETATSVSGDIVRNAGTVQHNGYVSITVRFSPTIT